MKVPLSVIILTYNEEVHLERCLLSLAFWADEIIVIDSHSKDKTKKIAEKYGAKVYEHDFKYQADQFNWALENVEIKNNWILRLDADEYVLPELAQEIQDVLHKPKFNVNAYYMKRRVYFLGRWMRHGGYYPIWFMRLFRKGMAKYEDREMDEHLILIEGEAEYLENDFVDHNLKGLKEFIERHNNYSSREARARFDLRRELLRGKVGGGQVDNKRWLKNNFYLKLPMFFRAWLYWLYRYVFRLGFLDGTEGLIFHFLQGFWHQFLIDAKMWEAEHLTK
jgi:glycosyltransferase involved in cell wall biosynthesis